MSGSCAEVFTSFQEMICMFFCQKLVDSIFFMYFLRSFCWGRAEKRKKKADHGLFFPSSLLYKIWFMNISYSTSIGRCVGSIGRRSCVWSQLQTPLLVGSMAVYCDQLRWKSWSPHSVSVLPHLKLLEISLVTRLQDRLVAQEVVKKPNEQTGSIKYHFCADTRDDGMH